MHDALTEKRLKFYLYHAGGHYFHVASRLVHQSAEDKAFLHQPFVWVR